MILAGPKLQFGVVIVNYCTARMALDAALSALGAGARRVVIVDNASPDTSLEVFRQAQSGLHASIAAAATFSGPMPVIVDISEVRVSILTEEPFENIAPLMILASARNRGFAAGCNLGLRTLIKDPEINAFLLLNPDTVISHNALDAFSARLHHETIGLCGATVVDFERPHLVQAFGGAVLDPVRLTGRNLGDRQRLCDAPDQDDIENAMSYPLGAAIALRRNYVDLAGFLDERYFLYFEEPDWTFAAGRAKRPGWAPDAIVYHRYGGASKSKRQPHGFPSQRSPLSDFHMTRSRILFARKWRPWLSPGMHAAGLVQAYFRLVRGRPENAQAVAAAALMWRHHPRR